MKQICYHLLICLLISSVFQLNAQQINETKSMLSWTGKAALSSYSLTGVIKVKSGHIKISNDSIQELKVVVDMNSIYHENKKLTKHLKSKDFFEVKKYQTATFVLQQPVVISNEKATLVGTLNIKETVENKKININIIQKNDLINISFNDTISRSIFGIEMRSSNFFKKMKDNGVADQFILKSELIFD